LRADNKTARIDLQFPSGSGALASDFESWLYLGNQAPATQPMQVKAVRFLNPDAVIIKEVSEFTPVPAGGTLNFKAGEHVSQVEIEFTKALNPNSLESNKAPGIYFMNTATGNKLAVALKLSSENIVSCTLQDPEIFVAGQYTLNCLGTLPAGAAMIIVADTDGSALDGDYDGSPGGNFVLAFKSV
jgi:hypothetical protein